jgi:hypothetical protein
MKNILLALAVVLGLCVGQPANAGIGFGIPLPFPFLVWTPSGHCEKGSHGGCGARSQEHPAASPKAADTHPRSTSGAKATS